ncbi:MAG: hypothetical protein HQL71_11030 [Magnetococcales bacterium]|nr:hypothetical protein [Magnetococcales bacterium]
MFRLALFLVLFVGTIYSVGVLSGKGLIPPYKISRIVLDFYDRYGPTPVDKKISQPIGELQIIRDEKKFVEIVKNRIKTTIQNPISKRDILKEAALIVDYNFSYLDSTEKAAFFEKHLTGKSLLSSNNMEVARVTYYGISHTGVLIRSSKSPQKKLLVWLHGHERHTFKYSYFNRIVEQAADAGFDVLTLSMTDYGFNEFGTTTFPTHNGLMGFKQKGHKFYSLFHDSKNPKLTGIAPMLSGNYHLIQNFIKNNGYHSIVMAGLSGGGWSTTFLSAMMPEIKHSISFAGTTPLGFRTPVSMGDYEQSFDRIYQKISYWDLYVLATMDTKGQSTRTHWQIFGSHDKIFGGAMAAAFVDILQRAGGIPNMDIRINKTSLHTPNVKNIKEYLLLAPNN